METPVEYISRLDYILSNLPKKTILCILLGSELRVEREKRPWMVGRELKHIEFNETLRKWADKKQNRVRLLSLDSVVNRQEDYDGSINHFSVRVYYNLAQEVIGMMNDITGGKIFRSTNRINTLVDFIIRRSKHLAKEVLPARLFVAVKLFYHNFKKH